jgi:hypothetical protein
VHPDHSEAMFDPPPFNLELPCELLAENTFEALRIVRQGDWVYKFLRPHDSFAGQTAEERRRQILLRVRESQRHVELNPLAYDEAGNCIVSRLVTGRTATRREAFALREHFARSGRKHIADLRSSNLKRSERGLIAIDFECVSPDTTGRRN